MAKKHPGYKPQQRIRTHENVSVPRAESSAPRTPEEVLQKLADLFEIDAHLAGETPTTFLGSVMAAINASGKAFMDMELSRDELIPLIPDIVLSVRDAAERLKADGFDPIQTHEIMSRKLAIPLFLAESQQQLTYTEEVMDIMKNGIDSFDFESLDDSALYQGLESTTYMRLLRIYMFSKRMAQAIEHQDLGFGIYTTYRDGALKGIEREMSQNPNSVRRETTKQLQYLYSDEVDAMLDYYGLAPGLHSEVVPKQDSVELFPAQELDFRVLPPGTDLKEFADEIINRLSEREKAHVDLKRLAVLDSIREFVGKDHCYYAHGKKSGKQMLDEETDTMIDEDYIVLVIQNLDEHGNTADEDALAISPIANKHAAYLTRYKASAGNWREILSLPKKDSREMGARDLRFTGATGRTPYAMMEEKIKALLACEPDDFRRELRMCGDGTYRVKHTERDMGRSANRFIVDLDMSNF